MTKTNAVGVRLVFHMVHTCLLPEEGHIHGYKRMALVMRKKRGVHRDGFTGARTEEVPETTTQRRLRREETKIANGTSLQGVANARSPPFMATRTGVVPVAPRSYWKSTPPVLLSVVSSAITLCSGLHNQKVTRASYVIYGHSLGGSTTVCFMPTLDRKE